MEWFNADRIGLAKIAARRGPVLAIGELIQNALDAPGVTRITLSLRSLPERRGVAELVVEDDSPEGFRHLTHAFTLFAESIKKADAELRGRFNFGEKLVIAMCNQARIETTTGTVAFDAKGRHEFPRRKRALGTRFWGEIRMTIPEVEEALREARTFIIPPTIDVVINNVLYDTAIAARQPLATVEHSLMTEVADADGLLQRRRRKTQIAIYEPMADMPGRIYEMGIPVVETGDRYDIDVRQRIPMSLDRDNVAPAYLREIRALVLNAVVGQLAIDDAASTWVSDALNSDLCARDAVRTLLTTRFGDKVVSYDPSDPEANHRAVEQGYVVLAGGQFNRDQWARVRASGIVLPAGQVTPTPTPFAEDGDPAELYPPTPAMQRFERFAKALAAALLGKPINVVFYKKFNAVMAYGNSTLYCCVQLLGKKWFEGPLRAEIVDILIHEYGHEYADNHLSREYHDALSRMGGAAVMLALTTPELFEWK